MPLITDSPVGQIRPLPDQPEVDSVDPTVGEVFSAGFRQENSLISMASNGFGFNNMQPEEGFDPYTDDNIQGYEVWAENFIDVKSSAEMSMKKTQIDQELEDRKTLDAGGIMGFTAQVAAGVTDPLYWPLIAIPGAAALRGAKSVGGAAMRLAAIGGVSEIPVEAAKQHSQETRSIEESALNIGGATILSGILGGAAKHLTTSEIKSISGKLDDVFNPGPTEIVHGNAVEKSLSAAATEQLTKEQLKPVSVGGLEKMGVSPLLRAENSPSIRTNQLTAEMMESATVKQTNVDGVSTIPEGGSAETRIKIWDAGLYQGLKDLDDFYTAYRAGKGTTTRIINDYVMRNRAGKMTPKEFREEVGRTMRRADKSTVPEVQQAAESFRKNLIDPLKNAAIDEKLLPVGIEPTTAATYLTRVYKTQKIIAQRPAWDNVVESWLTSTKKTASLADKPNAQQKLEAAMTDTEIKAIAEDITNNIIGVAAGRVPYEIIPNVRGPLKERTFNIPDSLIEDFLESDIDIIARQYKRTIAPDIELTRLYGNADMEQQLVEIADSYKELIDASKTEKARLKITNQMKNDQRDIGAMRDRLRGTYRTPDDPNGFFVRAGRTLRDVNFLRMLGGMTLSAIPDLARPIAVNGLLPVSRGLKALATNPNTFFASVKEGKRAAVGLDMVLNSRASSLADITDIYNRGTSFERGLRSMSDAYGKITLMSPWNTALKNFSGVITQDRILTATVDVVNGKASKSTVTRLAASGIGEKEAQAIARQFQKYGDEGSLNLSNGQLWDDKTALETFRAAVLKDVDRTIITPGEGEKPLWTSTETGKLIFQFKTFAATAHNKILVADLQYRDAAALNGFLLSVAFGTAAYGAKQFVAGKEVSTDPKKLIVESLDRSGAFGYFWDANNIVEKMTRGQVGVNRAIGAPPMSRYASRNIMGALLGPSAGTVEDLNAVTGAISEGDFTDKDLRKIRKLLPGQNLFYMRQLLNTLEEKAGESL